MRLPEEIASRLKGRLTLDIPEAGAYLGAGRRQSYEMANAGTLPTLQLTERRRVVPLGTFLSMLGFELPNEEGPAAAGPSPTPTDSLAKKENARESTRRAI